jgi:hypothetical protein
VDSNHQKNVQSDSVHNVSEVSTTNFFRRLVINMDMTFGTWNIRSLYSVGTLMTVSRELSRYRLNLVRVQDVRWEGSGTVPAEEYTFFYGKGNENHELGTVSLYIRESYQQLRGLSLLVKGGHT